MTLALPKRSPCNGHIPVVLVPVLNYSPKVWNALPASVRCEGLVIAFCMAHNTYFFTHPTEPQKL